MDSWEGIAKLFAWLPITEAFTALFITKGDRGMQNFAKLGSVILEMFEEDQTVIDSKDTMVVLSMRDNVVDSSAILDANFSGATKTTVVVEEEWSHADVWENVVEVDPGDRPAGQPMRE